MEQAQKLLARYGIDDWKHRWEQRQHFFCSEYAKNPVAYEPQPGLSFQQSVFCLCKTRTSESSHTETFSLLKHQNRSKKPPRRAARWQVSTAYDMMLIDAVTFGGQTLFSFPAVCGRKEVAHVRKKAFRLFMCAVILLYIFCIKAHWPLGWTPKRSMTTLSFWSIRVWLL